jgi:hypothetical protein
MNKVTTYFRVYFTKQLPDFRATLFNYSMISQSVPIGTRHRLVTLSTWRQTSTYWTAAITRATVRTSH